MKYQHNMPEEYIRNRKRRKRRHRLILLLSTIIILIAAGIALIILMQKQNKIDDVPGMDEDLTIEYMTESDTEEQALYVPSPMIDEQLLTVNPYSRPGEKIKALNYIVVHYLGNPGTTGQENHDYFESLKDLQNVYMSANYVIGLDGEIIHCVPDDEIAYASNKANPYSISIENCHVDDTGKLNDATYDSLVKLVAYLSEKYGIIKTRIIRHYDVTGKDCPKYFVENPDEWVKFQDEVMAYREKCRQEALQKQQVEAENETEFLGLSEFLENALEPSSEKTENE